MKKIFALLPLLLLTACASQGPAVTWEKTSFYELDLNGESYFFRYPEDASISDASDGLRIFYGDCKIFAGQDLQDFSDMTPAEKDRGEMKLIAWYKEDLLSAYDAEVTEFNYKFRVGDGSTDVSACIDLVEAVAESFSSQLDYVNEHYAYSLNLPSDFDVQYFEEEDGLVLRKTVQLELTAEEIEDEKEPQYRVEIVVAPFENVDNYYDVNSFVKEKYSGYSVEFAEFDGGSGFYVDEGAGGDAIRHFFALNRDRSAIFEAYLKLPSSFYNEHKETFDAFVSEIKFF